MLHKLEDIIHFPKYHQATYKRVFHKFQDIPECRTERCTERSLNMSRMMNTSADPCQDFYQYACGGWIAEGLPDDHAKWTIFSYLAEQTENKLRELIEGQKNAGMKEFKLVNKLHSFVIVLRYFLVSCKGKLTKCKCKCTEDIQAPYTETFWLKFIFFSSSFYP